MDIDISSFINKLKKELEKNKANICPICRDKLKISGFKPDKTIVLFIDCKRCGFKITYIIEAHNRGIGDYALIETEEVIAP